MSRDAAPGGKTLAGELASLLGAWNALENVAERESCLVEAGVERRLLRALNLPFDAPAEVFAPILAFGLEASLSSDSTNIQSVSRLVRSLERRAGADPSSVNRAARLLTEIDTAATKPPPVLGGPRATTAALRDYLTRMSSVLGMLETAFLGPNVPVRVDLAQLYVPLPTSAVVTAQISEDRSVSWAITGIRAGVNLSSLTCGTVQDSGPQLQIPRLSAGLRRVQAIVQHEGEGAIPGESGRPLALRPLAEPGSAIHVGVCGVEDVLVQCKRVLLVGGPGAGKSTTAKHAAVEAARLQLDPATLADDLLTDLFPVFISVNALSRWAEFTRQAAENPSETVLNFIVATELHSNDAARTELGQLARQGRLLLIVDGMDEVWISADDEEQGVDRRKLLGAVVAASLHTYPGVRSLITCRPEAEARHWPTLSQVGFSSVSLQPLSADHSEVVAARFLRLTGGDDLGRLVQRFRDLWHGGDDAILSVPLYVALFAASLTSTIEDVALPSRAVMIGEAVRLLAIRWSSSRSGEQAEGGDEDDRIDPRAAETRLIKALQRVAYQSVTVAKDVSTSSGGVEARVILGELMFFKSRLWDAFRYLVEESGLFEEVAESRYRFRLRPFEEYLAAAELVEETHSHLEGAADAMAAWPERWLEPIAIASELLATRLGAVSAAAALGGVLLDWSSDESRAWPLLWLVAASLDRLLSEDGLGADSGTCQRLSHRVLDGYPNQSNVSPYGRLAVGEMVARLGDIRPGVGAPRGIPSFDWIRIPPGIVTLGTGVKAARLMASESWADGWSIEYEQPAVALPLLGFAISRFPVTNVQFAAFVAASNGFYDERWWVGGTRPTSAPDGPWHDPCRRSDPVANINWYEAIAFCRWVSAELELLIRLPTEAEWEYAARGTECDGVARIFPWGDAFLPDRANGADSGLGMTTPVGLFPCPDGPWGLDTPLDMSGNVWEWCSSIHSAEDGTEYRHPYDPSDGREDLLADDTYRRVVRGGSFTNLPFFLRTPMRGHDRPSFRTARQGFRVVSGLEALG